MAYAENKDPVEEVDKLVAAYQNTSHNLTGKKEKVCSTGRLY